MFFSVEVDSVVVQGKRTTFVTGNFLVVLLTRVWVLLVVVVCQLTGKVRNDELEPCRKFPARNIQFYF